MYSNLVYLYKSDEKASVKTNISDIKTIEKYIHKRFCLAVSLYIEAARQKKIIIM